MARRKRTPPPPKALSFLVCDYIHRDTSTGKATLIGCFANLFTPSFPIKVPMMAVYAVVTNGHGKVPIRVRIIDAEEEREAVNDSLFEVEFTDPRMTAEVVGFLTDVTFPKAVNIDCNSTPGRNAWSNARSWSPRRRSNPCE